MGTEQTTKTAPCGCTFTGRVYSTRELHQGRPRPADWSPAHAARDGRRKEGGGVMNEIIVRKRLRDIRVGEKVVFDDILDPWAIVEDVSTFPVPNSAAVLFPEHWSVLLAHADGRIDWIGLLLDGWWDVAE